GPVRLRRVAAGGRRGLESVVRSAGAGGHGTLRGRLQWALAGRECYHCQQWVEDGEAHDCWTTTEAALTADLTEDLRDAWARLRETAAEFGEQRIYASQHSVRVARGA